VESKKERFVLLYLFVHQGSGTSGHYWGYGRNGNKWYKFDSVCTAIQQEDIMSDIEKLCATPYVMMYAKENEISSFDYSSLTDSQTMGSWDPLRFIPKELVKKIERENSEL
jgi:hypothetical protein